MKEISWIRVCPKCGSAKVGHTLVGILTGAYKCKKCGLEGPLFPEIKVKKC